MITAGLFSNTISFFKNIFGKMTTKFNDFVKSFNNNSKEIGNDLEKLNQLNTDELDKQTIDLLGQLNNFDNSLVGFIKELKNNI